jgi:ribosomal protein L37AE/L43A
LLAANSQAMFRPRADLERQLLRKSLGALTRDRHQCTDCGRTPLAGERIHRYEHGALVCALCRAHHPDEPAETMTVMHCEHGHTVRRLRAA